MFRVMKDFPQNFPTLSLNLSTYCLVISYHKNVNTDKNTVMKSKTLLNSDLIPPSNNWNSSYLLIKHSLFSFVLFYPFLPWPRQKWKNTSHLFSRILFATRAIFFFTKVILSEKNLPRTFCEIPGNVKPFSLDKSGQPLHTKEAEV